MAYYTSDFKELSLVGEIEAFKLYESFQLYSLLY